MNKAAFNIKLSGFPPANREAEVKLTNVATGQEVVRKPFLDGSLLVRDLDPGDWQVVVRHPNLVQPIEQRTVRLFPQPLPTLVPIPVPPDLFRDTPIRDIPDADLRPVQQTASAARDVTRPLATKAPGEVIRADDWNRLVGAVADLAGAVAELTRLVTPVGHDHPEIAEKIAEVQGNVRRFAESFGRSLVELRRDIENQNLRNNVGKVLDQAGTQLPDGLRERLFDRVTDLEKATQTPTPTFTGKLASTGLVLLTEVNNIAQAQGQNADQFLANPAVRQLVQTAQTYVDSGTQSNVEAELSTYQRTTTAVGGSKLAWLQG